MKYEKQPRRRSIRLKEYDYTNPSWYFVTICSYEKKCIFGKVNNGKMSLNEFGNIAKQEWLKTKIIRPNVDLDYYVIMPNHIHGIIIIKSRGVLQYAPTNKKLKSPSQTIGSIIRGFKSAVTKQINIFRETPSNPVWQRNYYEHILRNEMDLFFTRKYIKYNPLKWDLDKYFQGK